MEDKSILLTSTSPSHLVDLIDKKFKDRLVRLETKFQPKEPTIYLTRNEVAEMLKINLSSVHNWTKKGILISYGCQGRVYYKREEVEQAIIKLKY